MEKAIGIVKWAALVFGALFCFELTFGFTGTMIMVGGIAIRHLLFIFTFLCLYGFCLLYILKNHIPLFKSRGEQKSVFRSMDALDWLMLAFVAYTAFSALITPRLFGGNFQFAKAEALDSLMMLTLYFPLRYMIRWEEWDLRPLEKYVYWLVFALSCLHIVLYVGQSLNANFIEGFFSLWSSLTGGTAITPTIVLGHNGYPRVMYATSIYILLGFFLLLKRIDRFKWYDYVVFFVELVAMMTTMTKSIWFGFFLGVGVFLVLYVVVVLRRRRFAALAQVGALLVSSVVLLAAMDQTVFQHMISIRLGNAFVTSNTAPGGAAPSSPTAPGSDWADMYTMDREGAAFSNDLKIEQTKKLLEKWSGSPIIGYGYGSYIEDYLRSEECPFSYEMQFPALIMKTGLLGVGLLVALLVAMGVKLFRRTGKEERLLQFSWLYLLLSFGFCVQTNPLLLSFTGMSMVLMLLLESSCGRTTDANTENA